METKSLSEPSVHPHFTDERAKVAQEEMEQFWSDLDKESDRGMVLSAVAYFDKVLEDCLRGYFRSCKQSDELLSSTREIGTFSVRNKLCYSLRLVSLQEYSVLKLMANIRNEFAHSVLSKFEDAKIASRTHEMARVMFEENENLWLELQTDPSRKLFSFTAFCLSERVWIRPYDAMFHTLDYPDIVPDHTEKL
jgi:DNA-binding MltR family transcriptional regulator